MTWDSASELSSHLSCPDKGMDSPIPENTQWQEDHCSGVLPRGFQSGWEVRIFSAVICFAFLSRAEWEHYPMGLALGESYMLSHAGVRISKVNTRSFCLDA